MGIGDWGLGIGDWGLGIGDWAQSPIPQPPFPIPNPQSPSIVAQILKNSLFFFYSPSSYDTLPLENLFGSKHNYKVLAQ